jgi:hypothetical protein
MSESTDKWLDLSEAYRKSRSRISILCGIGLAWAAAQFEFKKLSLVGVGELDISGASAPLVFSLCILYSFIRCSTEYAIQPKEVRRWSLAQFDYKLSLNLVRFSVLLISASAICRSLETSLYVTFAAILYVVSSTACVAVGTFLFTPIFIFIRKRQGRTSTVARVREGEYLSQLLFIPASILIIPNSILRIAAYSPIDSLPKIDSNYMGLIVFTTISIIILLSVIYEEAALYRIFSLLEKDRKTGVVTIYDSDGEKSMVYKKVPD